VAEKPHDAVVKFDTYRNLQRHRAVLPAIARHLVLKMLLLDGGPNPTGPDPTQPNPRMDGPTHLWLVACFVDI